MCVPFVGRGFAHPTRRNPTTKGTQYTKKATLRAEADRAFEVGRLKVAGFSESGVGDAPAAWAFGKLSDWDTRFLGECVPRRAGTEPPDRSEERRVGKECCR